MHLSHGAYPGLKDLYRYRWSARDPFRSGTISGGPSPKTSRKHLLANRSILRDRKNSLAHVFPFHKGYSFVLACVAKELASLLIAKRSPEPDSLRNIFRTLDFVLDGYVPAAKYAEWFDGGREKANLRNDLHCDRRFEAADLSEGRSFRCPDSRHPESKDRPRLSVSAAAFRGDLCSAGRPFDNNE